jgi:pseudoazurin
MSSVLFSALRSAAVIPAPGRVAAVAALVLAASLATPGFAANFEVDMLNHGSDGSMMVFQPALTKVAVGDTVTFVAKDPGHDVQSIDGMLPDGATPIAGQMSQDLTVTFTVPGVYGIKCVPHFALGMVGLVVVGPVPPANLAAAQAVNVPALAKKRLDPLFTQISAAQ